jgi:hypothetical protein
MCRELPLLLYGDNSIYREKLHEAPGAMSVEDEGKLHMEKQTERIAYCAHPCRGGDHEA